MAMDSLHCVLLKFGYVTVDGCEILHQWLTFGNYDQMEIMDCSGINHLPIGSGFRNHPPYCGISTCSMRLKAMFVQDISQTDLHIVPLVQET